MSRAAAAFCLVASLIGCDDEHKPAGTQGSASASVLASAQLSAQPSATPRSPHASKLAPAETPSCRVMSVTGDAQNGGAALSAGALLDGTAWIILGRASSMALKHTLSGREFSITGPGRLRPCPRGEEAVWLSSGQLKAGSGMGVRPGATFQVSTPHGSAVWGDAQLAIAVSALQTSIQVERGQVALQLAATANLTGSTTVGAGQKSVLKAAGDPKTSATRLTESCEAAAAEAEKIAEAIILGKAPLITNRSTPGLGQLARDHTLARTKARSSCASAWAGVGAFEDPAKPLPEAAQALERRLVAADASWRRIPPLPGSAGSPSGSASASPAPSQAAPEDGE